MKHLMKMFFGLSIAVLLSVFISCPQTAGPNPQTPGGGTNSGSPSNPQTPPQQTPVEKALAELTVSPLKVFSAMTKVNLPTATSVSGVTISWAALPEGYINDDETSPDLGKVLKRESENKEVTLTATATDGTETKTKDFIITIYPASAAPSAQDLADTFTIQEMTSHDIDLPASVPGYPAAAITWTSADDKIIKIEDVSGQKKGIIGYDLIDKTVILTAKVSYKGQTAEKTFSVTVKRVEKITKEYSDSTSTYEFTGSEYIETDTDKATGKITRGTKYTYTDVQTAADGTKTALFTETAKYQSGKWVTAQEYIEEQTRVINQMLAELQKLKTKNPLVLRDFIPFINYFTPEPVPNDITDEEIFKLLKDILNISDTWEQFSASGTEQTAKLKESISSFEEMLNQQLAYLTPENMSPPVRYKYRFEKSGAPGNEKIDFRANALYNPAKPWYEQRGGYRFRNSASSAPAGKIMEMNLSAMERGSNQYEALISVSISDGANPSKNYGGPAPYTPGATAITAALQEGGSSGPSISVTISDINDDRTGKITANVIIDTGAPQPLTLQFEGEPLR